MKNYLICSFSRLTKISAAATFFVGVFGMSVHEGVAKDPTQKGVDIPVATESQDFQTLVHRVEELVGEVSSVTNSLKDVIDPEEFRKTAKQLNQVLENASQTIAPTGGLNQTAQRTLAKLEVAVEHFKDLISRVDNGEGSVGMILNDPSYANELKMSLQNLNLLLNKVSKVQFKVDMGTAYLFGYNGERSWVHLKIIPSLNRYYFLGAGFDPRGRLGYTTYTTTSNSKVHSTQVLINEPTGVLVTAQIGQLFFKRWDVAIGALYGDGALSISYHFGPDEDMQILTLRNDFYVRTSVSGFDDRLTLQYEPFHGVYFRAGLDSVRRIGVTAAASWPWFIGGGLRFDDDDIKILFAFR